MTRVPSSRAILSMVVLALTVALPPAANAADALIVAVQGSDMKPGTELKATQSVTLPAGASIQVLMPSGATLTMQGPFTGSITDYSRSRGASTGLENSSTRGLGGNRGPSAGGTR
jgi:hypothetical protein